MIASERLTEDTTVLRKDWETLSSIRDAIRLALESAREDKHVGSSLQCSVVINVGGDEDATRDCLARYSSELDAIFVVSSAVVNSAVPDSPSWAYEQPFGRERQRGTVTILPPTEHKCPRCWRYISAEEDDLCNRCDEVMAALPGSSTC